MNYTLSELIEEHLSGKVGLQENTKEHRQLAWQKFVGFKDDVSIHEVTTKDAEKFQSYLLTLGLERVSVNSYIKAVSTVWNWAARHKIIDSAANPFSEIDYLAVAKKQKAIYQPDEVEIALSISDSIEKLWLRLGLDCGMRSGEILNLVISDIDFIHKLIYIQRKERTATTWPYSPKHNKSRVVPITDELAKLLVDRINALPVGQPYLCLTNKVYQARIKEQNEGRLTERNRKTPDQNFRRKFRNLMRRANVKGKTPHCLRYSSATILAEQDVPLQDISAFLGHASLKTTEGYIVCRSGHIDRIRSAQEQIRGDRT
jgi:integrase